VYGLIVKIRTATGKRDEMIAILQGSAASMSGCKSYVVAKDTAEEDTLWVTEVWDSAESHEASLSIPEVRNAIPRAKAIVSTFERIAATQPVWDGALPAAYGL
jgi:quinol monooxygenase YgiN